MSATVVDAAMLDPLVIAARANPRRRMNRNLHRMEDPIHRLLNAMEPDSYVAPHRHREPPRAETLLIVRGRGAIVLFDDAGAVREEFVMAAGGTTPCVELEAGAWHTVIALEPGTVWFEVKQGPYVPVAAADLASFAPPAGTPAAAAWLERLRRRVESR